MFRRFVRGASLLPLLVALVALSIDSRAPFQSCGQHLSKHYKATDTTECGIQALPAEVARRPVAVTPADYDAEFLPPLPGAPAVANRASYPAHALRAPPAA